VNSILLTYKMFVVEDFYVSECCVGFSSPVHPRPLRLSIGGPQITRFFYVNCANNLGRTALGVLSVDESGVPKLTRL
jgi:hypothetical protein